MRPIYKSLALAAMTLQVSLALNAETRDDESASTMALPADLLDSLRVELVALNVSGARNLIESGECVIDGSNLTITLDTSEWTRGAMYRVQVLATFGTQTQVIYALNVTVPYYVAFSEGPQEFSDNVTIVSTITDVTEADLEGLALEATSQEIKTAVNGQAQDLEALAQSYGRLAADLQAIKDAHILGFSYDGLIFVEGYEPRGAFGIIAERQHLLEVHDNEDAVIPQMVATDYPDLEVFEMTNATSSSYAAAPHGLKSWMKDSASLRKVIIPKLSGRDGYWEPVEFLYRMPQLREVNILDFIAQYSAANAPFVDCIRLINLTWGKNMNESSVFLNGWSPTEALKNDTTSLLTQEDIAAGFTSNREKLLYNIREHIVANLPDRTGLSSCTLTFTQVLRDAFDQATEDAFAAKNWDIAPARS